MTSTPVCTPSSGSCSVSWTGWAIHVQSACELGTPKRLWKTVLNFEVVLFLRSICVCQIRLGTGLAVFNSQVVPVSQVVVKTGFTVLLYSVWRTWIQYKPSSKDTFSLLFLKCLMWSYLIWTELLSMIYNTIKASKHPVGSIKRAPTSSIYPDKFTLPSCCCNTTALDCSILQSRGVNSIWYAKSFVSPSPPRPRSPWPWGCGMSTS